jgi:hypothetical protein
MLGQALIIYAAPALTINQPSDNVMTIDFPAKFSRFIKRSGDRDFILPIFQQYILISPGKPKLRIRMTLGFKGEI